jgi:rubrerythrin
VRDGKEEESLKKGEKYRCQKCGLIVTIESPCTCTACDLICCGLPLKPVKK